MAVTYSATVKTNRMTQVLNAIDGGTGAGKIVLRDSGNAVLVTISFNGGTKPSGTVSGSALTFGGTNSATATGTGTATNAVIYQTDGTTVVVSGLTVGTSSADIIVGSTSIASGQTVTISNTSALNHA